MTSYAFKQGITRNFIQKFSLLFQTAPFISISKTKWLMVHMGTIHVYCKNHMEHTNKQQGNNVEHLTVKPDVTGLLVPEVSLPFCPLSDESPFLAGEGEYSCPDWP